ncbi:hypothetical protein EYC08_01355 [Tabrizicola sp. WMC-M-20]|nr:hypothetical protein EYC08_01355 [Tabrizicola sp. WMC-M-20]
MTTEEFSAFEGVHYGYRPAQGSAPMLVFGNSLGTDLRVWDRVCTGLPAAWGILRHDNRGHGLSVARAGLSIESMADDV